MSQFKSILPKRDPSGAPRQKRSSDEEEILQRGGRVDARRASRKKEGRSVRKASRLNNAAEQGRSYRKRSPFNRSSLGVVALFVILLLILIPTALTLNSTSKQLTETKAMQSSLEAQREELQTSVNDLKSQLDIVNTDQFIEKYAHEKLGMLRPNEILVDMGDGTMQINQDALAKYKAEQEQKAAQASSTAPAAESASTQPTASGDTNASTAPLAEQSPESSASNNGQ